MSDLPGGFECDGLEADELASRERDPLLAMAEARQARRSAIIDRLLQAAVFAAYCLGVAVLVLSIAYFGVSRRADKVVKDVSHELDQESRFREQVRAALTCLTDRARCSDADLRVTLDALATDRVPPPTPAVSPTTRPLGFPTASTSTTRPRPSSARAAPPTMPPPTSAPPTTRPAPPSTTRPCPTIPVVGVCRPGGSP